MQTTGAEATSAAARAASASRDEGHRVEAALKGSAARLSIAAAALLIALKTATWDPLESTCRHASLSIL